MNPLKKLTSKILGNKGKKKQLDPVSKILTVNAKIMTYGIGASVAFFVAIIVVILAVISYFLGFVQQMVEDVSRMAQAGCIFCSEADLERLKEEQFKSKIMIIEETFGEQVDGVVLASTVLFQGDYYEVIDSQYDTNYNEETYRDFWSQMKEGIRSLTYNEDDGYAGITTEEINLIDAATIVMVESNVDGKYNEDSYKHALTVNGFIEDPVRNSWICFTEGTRGVLETIWDSNPFVAAYNLLTQGTTDTIADNALQMVNTVDICTNGFIGGTYANIATIQDEDQKQREKEKIAQNIIDFAKFYRQLFPELATNNTAGSVCYYKVPYIDEEISNLKVQTIQCESGNVSGGPYDDISTEGLIDFENIYIPGVVYAEFGGADEETMKTQAVATRSYALTRHMPGANIGITLEDGQWVLRIRTCTSDQVFCHPVLGCHSITGSMQGTTSGGDTVYAGADDSGNYTRQPLADDNPIYERVEATKGEVAVDSSGTVVNTGFVSTDQNAWASMAAGGMNYKNIIINYYSDKGVSDVKSDCRGGGNGIYTTEQLEEYVQLSNAASVTRNHASVDLASSEYGSIEVFNQHIKDNVNNAGYGTRQAVVAAGVSFVGDYIRSTGKRIRYDQRNRQQPLNEGIVNDNLYLDCSGFAWWSLYNAGFKLPCYAQTDYMYFWARGAGYVSDIRSGQAGDYLLTKGKGHIMLIIGTYEDGYYVAHAAGWSVGVKIDKIPYSYLSGGYVVVNMEDYYNNSDNLR